MANELTFKCKCGSFEAQIHGNPVLSITCHCHSCVAAVKFLESKSTFDGISALDNDGVALALYRGKNIDWVSDVSSEEAHAKIGFVKVGEKGKPFRSYCSNCGTFIAHYERNFSMFNRNAIYNKDGTKFQATAGSVNNIMRKYSFDPSKVPAHSSSMVPLGVLVAFVPLLMGFGGKKNAHEDVLFPTDLSNVEVVPITWK